MIRALLSQNFKHTINPDFEKFSDACFDIFVENNRNIVVFDKKNNKWYLDLRQAYLTLPDLKKLP